MYDLSNSQIKGIANLCKQEQGTWQGAAAEATLASNILRTSEYYKNKFGNDIYSFMRHSGWFYNAAYYMDNGDADNEYVRIIKDVLVKGNFTLPLGVNEHDCFRDIKWARNGDTYIDKTDRSAYIPHVTRIRNVMGSEYTFYCFPAPASDPFGYTDSNKKYMGKSVKLNDVISVIQSFHGCNEADGSHKKIIDIYNGHKPLPRGYKVKYTDAWCATYVSAVFIMCGDDSFMECGCPEMIEKLKSLGYWKGRNYTPKTGTIVFYDWNGDRIADHVGIVRTRNNDNTLIVDEGNIQDSAKQRVISGDSSAIFGYAQPIYDEGKTEKVIEKYDFHFETVKHGDINGYVRVLQIFMNAFGYYENKIDGEFGDGTLKAVNAYQARRIKEGCDIGTDGKPDGVCGGKMWNDLMGV